MGGGEMSRRIREFVWANTAVGPVERWPESLRSIVRMMLHARHPMFLWWGPELIQFYNDGYVPSFGAGRHPSALGQRGKDCWNEIWPIIGPQIDSVIASATATYHEDALVPIFRNGRMEEVYWTYGYSPVFDAAGAVAGVLVVVTETTTRVVALRRLETTRSLADEVMLATDHDELLRACVRVVGRVAEDAPWAVAFRMDGNNTPRVVASSNIDEPARTLVGSRALEQLTGRNSNPVAVDVSDLGLPGGPWPEPSTHAFAIIIPGRDANVQHVLVTGQSPRLPVDLASAAHIRGIARQLALAATRIDSQSAQAAAELAREDLLLQAPFAAALMVGPSWRFILANALYERMVGRSVLGRDWHDCFPELLGSPVDAILQRVYRDGVAFEASEQLIPLECDGVVENRFFDFNMIPIRAGSGAVDAMMIVAVEVTAKVIARREIERTAMEREALVVELKAASRAKDEFLAMMGHELRNPLAPLITALSLIRARGSVSAEHHIIERQVSHMTRLVDDLLDISRVTQGKLELRRATSDVSELAMHAVEMASPLFEKRDHHLDVDVTSNLWWYGDPTRFEQVLSNLLTNAAHYTEPGGQICLDIHAELEVLVVRVRDNGRGIDPQLLANVFSPFVQSDRGPDRREGGLGLGLAIVQGLVVAHGGTVEARSEGPGRGSEFVVRVPGVVPQPARTRTPTLDLVSDRPQQHVRVLLVDDNEDAAFLTGEALTIAGHDVTIAHDGPNALAVAANKEPEIAILDIGLPGMDGYELVQCLRDQAGERRCRYVALTGYGRAEDIERAIAAGFERLLVKPVPIQTLIALVDSTAASS